MDGYKNKWSSNPDIVKRFFIFASKINITSRNIFINLLCVSKLYHFIGVKQRQRTGACKCNCTKMKQYKISDSIKKWMCEGCDDRISDNSWKQREYHFGKDNIYKTICKKCYNDHWIDVLHRPFTLCIIDEN